MASFWPFAVGIGGSLLAAIVVAVFMIKVQRPDLKGKGPRHRWNRQYDKLVAEDQEKSLSE